VCYGPRIACSLGKLTNYSGFWEVDSYVQSPLASLYAVRSLAIDWLCTRGNTPLFIYFQREFRSIQTPLYVGRSLAGQLLMADISDPPDAALLKAYETVKQKSGSATPEFADLCSYTCTKFSHLFGKIVVFVDAFDECDPDEQVTIAELIERFNDSGIRTCITTRPHNKLYLPSNAVALEIAAKDEDVENYIRQEIERRRIKLHPEVEEDIIRQVSEGVDGMYNFLLVGSAKGRFLLARLRLGYVIRGGNVPIQDDMEYRSKRLPGNQVRDYYRIIIKDIVDIGEPTTHRALEALAWILYAKFPLSERTLREAVLAPSTEAILGPCMSLIVLSAGVFQFSHTTSVTEFLADPNNVKDLGAKLPTQLDIAKRCIQYLDSPESGALKVWYEPEYDPELGFNLASDVLAGWGELADRMDARGGFGFARYAARNWADHARAVEHDLLINGMVGLSYFKFLSSRQKYTVMLNFNDMSYTTTALHFATKVGLTKFCELCLEARTGSVQNINRY
jgi:hypothetical protein